MMSFFGKLAGFFSRDSRDDNKLLEGVEHAKAKRPEKAIEIYNSLIAGKSTSSTVKARALYNRAIAYSAMKEVDKAMADLEEVIGMPGLPANVLTAAKDRMSRVKKRSL